jgi:serine/threonine protein kinase
MADDPSEQRHAVDRTEHHTALALGTRVGRYEIVAILGQGAFGITYRARDLQLDREVALKEYLPALLATRIDGVTVLPRSTQTADDFAWGRSRFLDEARTMARLAQVPAVVQVHDFLEANGTAYVVMQLIEGETLGARRRRQGALAPPAVERILAPLLDGLEQVHAKGILHRDIKPENIIIGPDGSPTLIDFGASRVAIADRTQALTAVFTPAYAAPEQITSGQQGPYTDIYAMAATLYACVSGLEPVSAAKRMMADAAMPSAHEVAGVGFGDNLLSAIDAGLLAKPEQRPQSIRAWREVFATGKWPYLRSSDGTVAAEEGGPSATVKVGAVRPSQARRRRPLLLGAAAAAVVAFGGTAVWLALDHLAPPPSPEAQLEAALARSIPAAPANSRKQEADGYTRSPINRALAVAPRAGRLRYTASWPTRGLAEERALEKCQQVNDEPCALIAVNDTVLPSGADGKWPVRDAPRVRYAGAFNLEHIPGMREADLQRPEIAGYAAAPGPKAMAFNAWGVLTVAVGAASQRGAEEKALQDCRGDAARLKADAACYLYAIENRVVLPLRATTPVTAAPVAPPPPPEPTLHARLVEALARAAPSSTAAARESLATAYESSRQHRALAAFPSANTWRSSGWANATLAEERALEGCEVRYGRPCVLVALDDVVQPADALALRRPMPRAMWDGGFDPEKIPGVDEALRHRPEVAGYRTAKGPKAAAFHPSGRLFVATDGTSQRDVEERALGDCAKELHSNPQSDPCFLYAVGDHVVLLRRATAPMSRE